MDYGFHFFDFTVPGVPATTAPTLRRAAQAGEAVGATWLTVMDHFFQMEFVAPATDPMLESYTTLGYLAGVTEKAQLGTVVTGVTYRHPGLLAKTVTTLDVLSGGRAFLGIGAAWYEREHLALGVPYPPLAERFERLEEALAIVRQMWSDDDGPFEGKHYQLAETICSPRPLSTPRPPIVIGGSGERKTLRLVAKYADATNLIVSGPDEAAHKIDVLRAHCDDLGRDFAQITLTVQGDRTWPRDLDGAARNAQAYAALGISRVHYGVPGPDPEAVVDLFGRELAPRLADL